MQIVLRTATLEDYDVLYLLYAQLDQVHTEAIPEFFRSVEEPARSREYFAEIIANKVQLFLLQSTREHLWARFIA